MPEDAQEITDEAEEEMPEDAQEITDEAQEDMPDGAFDELLSGIGQGVSLAIGKSSMFHMNHSLLDKEDSQEENLPFTVPFETGSYTGKITVLSKSQRFKHLPTGAVGYYKLDAKHIYLGLAANSGWVGFGFNPAFPSMRGADFVICRDHKADGTVTAADYYALGNQAPTLDNVQDWTVLAGGHIGDPKSKSSYKNAKDRVVTWCELRRPRETCEKRLVDFQAYEGKDTPLV